MIWNRFRVRRPRRFRSYRPFVEPLEDRWLMTLPANLTVQEGMPFRGTVLLFNRSDLVDPTVQNIRTVIDWGDGVQTSGSVSTSDNQNFSVDGTHVYKSRDAYDVRIDVTGTQPPPNSADITTSIHNSIAVTDAPITATGVPFQVVEGASFQRVVATVHDDNPFGSPDDLSAFITWGDNTISNGIVRKAANGTEFEVLPDSPHTYVDVHPFAVSVAVSSSGGQSSTANTTASVINAPLSASAQNISTIEGQFFSGAVATFQDDNSFSGPGDFKANIDWGDGQSTPGAITVDSKHNFQVNGTHTYTFVGSHQFTVEIIDAKAQRDSAPNPVPGGDRTLASASVLVTNAALSSQAMNLMDVEGQSFNGFVATFQDANPFSVPGDFKANIDWGDGQITQGSISVDRNHQFEVQGTHTYTFVGSHQFSVEIIDDKAQRDSAPNPAPGGDRTLASASVLVANAALSAQAMNLTAVEGQSFNGLVATFQDGNPFSVPGDFKASITWGDGQVTSGSITVDANHLFQVNGTHISTLVGTRPTHVDIIDSKARQDVGAGAVPGGDQTQAKAQITVSNAALVLEGTDLNIVEGQTFNGAVAQLFDANPFSAPGDFTAMIDWGDGQVTPGTVSSKTGPYTILGSHTYLVVGDYHVQVHLEDLKAERDAGPGPVPGGSLASSASQVISSNAALHAQGVNIAATEGQLFQGVVANLQDGNPFTSASAFKVMIDWGDGQTSAGILVPGNGPNYQVLGIHKYDVPGAYAAHIDVLDIKAQLEAAGHPTANGLVPGGDTAQADSQASIADALLAVSLLIDSGREGTPLPQLIARIQDGNPQGKAQDLSATILWGDGTSSVGNVQQANGGFAVAANHTYSDGGKYTVQVDVHSKFGSSAQTSGIVSIENPPLVVTALDFNASTAVHFAGPVATFVDTGVTNPPGTYTARINWGDGSAPTPGTIQLVNGALTVVGEHDFPNGGKNAIVVTVSDRDNGSNSGVGSATIAGPVIAISGASRVNASSTYTLSIAANEIARLLLTSLTVAWGDKTPNETIGNIASALTSGVSHVYAVGTVAGSILVTGHYSRGTDTISNRRTVSVIDPVGTPGGVVDSSSIDAGPGITILPGIEPNSNSSNLGISGTFESAPGAHGNSQAGITISTYNGNPRPDNSVNPFVVNSTVTVVGPEGQTISSLSAGFFDIKVTGANEGDVLTVTFSYDPTAAGKPTLSFYDEVQKHYTQVVSNSIITDEINHKLTVRLDKFSIPSILDLGHTVFTITVPAPQSATVNTASQVVVNAAGLSSNGRASDTAALGNLTRSTTFAGSSQLTLSLRLTQESRLTSEGPNGTADTDSGTALEDDITFLRKMLGDEGFMNLWFELEWPGATPTKAVPQKKSQAGPNAQQDGHPTQENQPKDLGGKGTTISVPPVQAPKQETPSQKDEVQSLLLPELDFAPLGWHSRWESAPVATVFEQGDPTLDARLAVAALALGLGWQLQLDPERRPRKRAQF